MAKPNKSGKFNVLFTTLMLSSGGHVSGEDHGPSVVDLFGTNGPNLPTGFNLVGSAADILPELEASPEDDKAKSAVIYDMLPLESPADGSLPSQSLTSSGRPSGEHQRTRSIPNPFAKLFDPKDWLDKGK